MDDFYVRYVDLPTTIEGTTVIECDGSYSIYINSRLSLEVQKRVLKHELQHIKCDDFYSFEHVAVLENRITR